MGNLFPGKRGPLNPGNAHIVGHKLRGNNPIPGKGINMETIQIAIKKDLEGRMENVPVKALIMWPLAIHRQLKKGEPDPRGVFTITHVKTGYKAFPSVFTLRKNAVKVANEIKDLDWDFDSPKSLKVKAMKKRILEIRDGVFGRSICGIQ